MRFIFLDDWPNVSFLLTAVDDCLVSPLKYLGILALYSGAKFLFCERNFELHWGVAISIQISRHIAVWFDERFDRIARWYAVDNEAILRIKLPSYSIIYIYCLLCCRPQFTPNSNFSLVAFTATICSLAPPLLLLIYLNFCFIWFIYWLLLWWNFKRIAVVTAFNSIHVACIATSLSILITSSFFLSDIIIKILCLLTNFRIWIRILLNICNHEHCCCCDVISYYGELFLVVGFFFIVCFKFTPKHILYVTLQCSAY